MAGPGTLEFRKDINGLRAYAVMAVLLYHFEMAGITGGYAGVDVFFVISGFLMTAIILPRVESGRFSLSGFYLARVRRILPALAVLCIAVLAFGWFFLAPYLYASLGKNAGASLLFISNFTYNRAGGYFAAPAHDNWLLHTWSLSVEWQFYLLYPLLLMLLARLPRPSRGLVGAALLFILLASWAVAVYLTSAKPTSAFFMLPARAWELLAGSLVFLYSGHPLQEKYRRPAEFAGLTLIALTILTFDRNTPWPGIAAVLPVLGACLILTAARQESVWTGNPFAQSLGRWSYSIYLWHWPLVVGLGYFGLHEEWPWLLAAMIASILLGALSYRMVEQPSSRWMRDLGARQAWVTAWAGFSLVFGVAAFAYFDHGVARTFRLPTEVLIAAGEKENKGKLTKCNTPQSQCVLGRGNILAVVWGDSHAIAAVNGVAEAAKRAGGSILFFGQQACPVIFGARSGHKTSPDFCADFNDMVFERLRHMDPAIPVIIIHRAGAYIEPGERQLFFGDGAPETAGKRWQVYERHLVDSLCRIAASHPVHVMLPIPEMPYDVPAVLSRSLILSGRAPQPAISLADYRKHHTAMIAALQNAKASCGVQLLDPLPYLCNESQCIGTVDGRPLYSDDNHLSNTGASRLAGLYPQVWKK
jgi:peptidoglycan/LPS O-acetylase OafA/YrhL